jgi:uncharacterized protein (DUF58 family)
VTALSRALTRAPSPKLGAYAGLAAAALFAALVLRRPELAVLAAPFALVLGLGLALSERPEVAASVHVAPDRLVEGGELVVTVELASATAVERLEVLVELPPGLTPLEGAHARALRLQAGERRAFPLRVRADRWGGYALGRVHLRARGPFGLVVEEESLEQPAPVRVYPREEELRRLVAPVETQLSAGNEVSRAKGDGIEFADVRPFAAGDRIRRVNWRASARRGELWVNETHPERNTDVILFLDTFAEARRGGRSTLDPTIRAAASLADRYLRRRDRVGVVGFGGVLRWLLPGMGRTQAYRIADALLDTEIVLSYAWKDVEIIPARTLPPQALVLALTPLLDERAVDALLDLRARGFDLAIVDVSPLPFAAPGPDPLDELAWRIWRLRREALRFRYERAGVAVAEWRDGEPLQVPIEEVTQFRRRARRLRV